MRGEGIKPLESNISSMGYEKGGEILEKMSDNSRPDGAGADIEERKHRPVHGDNYKSRQSLIGMAGAKGNC